MGYMFMIHLLFADDVMCVLTSSANSRWFITIFPTMHTALTVPDDDVITCSGVKNAF